MGNIVHVGRVGRGGRGNRGDIGDRGLRRTSSYRRPKAKPGYLDHRQTKDDSSLLTHQQTEEKETTHTELDKKDTDLELLAEATVTERKKIDSLAQLLLDSRTDQNRNESKDETIRRLKNVMKYVADDLKDIQKPSLLINGLDVQLHELQPDIISAPVQLFYIHESSVITEIVKDLKSMLNRKLGTVNFIHCPNSIDIDQEKLLIIVCIVTTRLGADAARAIRDIRNPDNAALLIIHVTEAHCLPKQISSRHLTDEGFKNLRGIFDMAFKSGNGFFHCDMNGKSLNGLSLFCQQPAYGEKL